MATDFSPLRFFRVRHKPDPNTAQVYSKKASEDKLVMESGIASTEEFLGRSGAGNNSIQASSADVDIASTDDYLPPNSLTSPEDQLRRIELENHLKLRTWLLTTVILPMAIIPIWLMCLLSEPVLNKESRVTEHMQLAYLGAIATDVFGLYQIVMLNLFPAGKPEEKHRPYK